MRDLSRLARKIQMDNMRIIAIEQLGIDYTDINNIAADCQEKSYQFNFEILNKWWRRSHENNRAVSDLYICILYLGYFRTSATKYNITMWSSKSYGTTFLPFFHTTVNRKFSHLCFSETGSPSERGGGRRCG